MCKRMMKCFVCRNEVKCLEITNVCVKQANSPLKVASNPLVNQN